MPAIKDGRTIATAGFPAPAGWAPSMIPALITGFVAALAAVVVAPLVRAALESLFSLSIAHGTACLTRTE
jgi:hypothetical protein